MRVILTVLAVVAVGSCLAAAHATRGSGQPPEAAQSRPEGEFSGAALFRTHCASCHGASARGNGPIATLFRRPPPDLTRIAQRHNGVFPRETVSRIIDGRAPVKGHGGHIMPVWGYAFSRSAQGGDEATARRKIQALVTYLDGIQERSSE